MGLGLGGEEGCGCNQTVKQINKQINEEQNATEIRFKTYLFLYFQTLLNTACSLW